ncbi:YhdP family protein [Rhodanobacter sp. 115]|uniref:YhdP family protein n=2 Tax=Rhodanobacter sp. FW021-MT20 TaxID=1162282 RepID=UPI0034E40175
MNVSWQHRLHRCARALGWTAGVLVIVLAISAALAQVLLPLLARHPQWVAAQLSERLHRPVSFNSLEGRWQPSGPLFVMHDVTIGVGQGETGSPLHIPQAALKLDFGGWLLPSRHLLNLRARGLQLDLSHDADGAWHVNGIGVAGGKDRQSTSFGRLSLGLWLSDVRLDIADARTDKHYTLIADALRLSRQGSTIRVGALLHRVDAAGNVRGAGRFRDDGSSGRLWLSAHDADLHKLLDGIDMGGYQVDAGYGSVSTWLDWKRGKVVRSLARLDLTDVVVGNPQGGKASVPSVHATADVRGIPGGYALRWAGDTSGALALNLLYPGTPQASIAAAASDLQLAPLLPWLALKPKLSPALADWLGQGHPHGLLEEASLRWSQTAGLQSLTVDFNDLGIDAAGTLPGVDRLQGTLRGDAEAISLELPAQATTLRFPHVFRQPFVMAKLGGTLAFWQGDDDWHIGVAGLDFEGQGFGGSARGEMDLHDAGGAPFLDMYVHLAHADTAAAKLFWPINAMPAGTVKWLDDALVSGTVDDADVLVRGDLKDWPFHHNEGRFEAHAELSDLTFDYGKDWPQAQGIHATAYFIDNSMLVQADAGQSLGVKVDKAVALIPDFGHGVLDLNINGGGSSASLLDFVRKSPIGSRQADVLSKFKLGGSSSFNFHLSLPLADAADFTLAGNAQFKDMDVNAPDWSLKLDKLSGPATFDGHGFHAGPLTGSARGEQSTLDLAIAGATGDPSTVVSAKLSGNYSVAELLQGYPQLSWLGDIAHGKSDFSIGFDITKPAGGNGPVAQTLSVDSPLTGIALDFPVPLKKAPADTGLPLHLSMSMPVAGSDLQVAMGDAMRGRFRLPAGDQQPLAATLAFGTQMPALDTLPAKGMRIRGQADQLDVTGWVQYSMAGNSSGGPGLESIDIGASHARLFGHDFASMQIKAVPKGDTLGIDVDSKAMSGHFDVPTTDLSKRGITARLKRLYWPKETFSTGNGKGTATPASDPANTGIDPAALPPLHMVVGDLRLGDANLGQARLETWPTAKGMHIDQLRALSHSVQVSGSGNWDGTATNSHTHMRIDFAADNLGDMLSAFGFDHIFSGGKTHDELDATWPGAPSSLELANMDGKLSIDVSNGRIPDLAPGVGRLFGLISVGELPRRLSLDFGDVFGKGLGFDSITGDFALANGNAVTHNLKIRGPAAEISIDGRTGLRAKDYDQQVTVVPHLGNSLPVVGAVVAGPVGVAAGLAVQGLLGKGLNHAALRRYHVTGSWSKPVMTLVEKRDLPTSQAVPAPSGSTAPAPAISTPSRPASSAPAQPAATQPVAPPATTRGTGTTPAAAASAGGPP